MCVSVCCLSSPLICAFPFRKLRKKRTILALSPMHLSIYLLLFFLIDCCVLFFTFSQTTPLITSPKCHYIVLFLISLAFCRTVGGQFPKSAISATPTSIWTQPFKLFSLQDLKNEYVFLIWQELTRFQLEGWFVMLWENKDEEKKKEWKGGEKGMHYI